MQLKNYLFEDLENLEKYIKNEIFQFLQKEIFIQLFLSNTNSIQLKNILTSLKTLLPNCKIVGSSTKNIINNSTRQKDKLLISFSIFDKTKVRTIYTNNFENSNAIKLSKEFITNETKAILVFNCKRENKIESFLDGFNFNLKNQVLVGGNATSFNSSSKAFLIEDTNIYEEGIVLVALDSKDLIVSTNHIFNWSKVGKEMTITKLEDNKVYEIDNIPILELYKKYFGDEIDFNLTGSLISFPLVKEIDGIDIARSIISVEEDNSFIYAGELKVGDKVRFALGNLDEIYNNSLNLQKELSTQPIEAIYVYTCKERNYFLSEQLDIELKAISQVANTAGLFTRGEFYKISNNIVQMNITTTLLTLSESTEIKNFKPLETKYKKYSSLKALINLVNKVQEELDENINYLNQYKNAIDKQTIVSKTTPQGIITEVNSKFCEISGYSKEELLGKPHNIVRHPEFPKENFFKMWETIKNKEVFQGIIKNMAKDGKSYFVDTVIKPILDKNGNIVEYLGLRHDITAFMNQKIQLKEELKTLVNPFLAIVKIEDYKLLKDFYDDEIIHQIEDKFSLEILNFLPSKSGYEKVYVLGEGSYAFIKDLDNNSKAQIEYEIALLKKFQTNVKYATLDFINFEFDISVIISVSNALKNTYKEAKLGIEKLNKTKKDFIYAQDLSINLNEIAKNNIETIKMIKKAILTNNITSYFQPIYNNKTKQIEKYESLVRLIDNQGKIISPYFFIDIAKKGRYYKQITNIVIDNSFNAMKKLQKAVTINLSIIDIEDEHLRNKIYNNLASIGSLAQNVTFELLEDENVRDFSIVKEFIHKVKTYGVNIAIDDFGSGYSNFERLLDFEPTILKIDGSLIKNILTDSFSRNIVEAIILFAKKEKLKTVAEFVSSKEIFDLVNELDIDYSQGYYISEPKALLDLI
ncbi:hypothetical protein CP985_13690 [Malaciobacter mytili LMG 24559]|uniref:PAS sensor-containing diguanylate cyclase/phosphodiesterase n=1 Tax=Malaciobacter mytili LMG 24559 TaxID=1032238 RepID=A0AAX2ABP7_9BACT|nr:EAL domain-containing protein [Malaciobacter mytili]AXH14957.1 multi-sensor domain-containing diguanylate phosphodiesterase [Malaciobacter mytili LMG 24559]RXK12968.1 hypothetical protein CP985_13690 [Malaciobacter mytili LMG 24559]